MEQLETIQKRLDALTSIQLLFSGERLVLINAYGQKMLPGIVPGASAGDVLGPGAEDLAGFTGSGSLLFPAVSGGLSLDAKATAWDGYTAVELMFPAEALSASALRSISEGLLSPMTTIMSLSHRLMEQLEESGGPATLERTAQFNQGIYTLFRAATHLQLSGADHRELSLSRKRLELSGWLREKMQALEAAVSLARRNLVLDLPNLGKMAEIDPEQLERALLNLISNAIKFTPPGGTITVSAARASRDRVRITIRDNGCGIAPHEMGIIFQRKEHRPQLPDPRTGIGLGLPLARNIVTAHGGSLLLESQEGLGTSVHLFLPPVRPGELSLRSQIQLPIQAGGFNVTLLELSDVLPSSAFDSRGLD